MSHTHTPRCPCFLGSVSSNFPIVGEEKRQSQPIEIQEFPPRQSNYNLTCNGPHSLAVTRWLSEIWGTPNICWVDGGPCCRQEKIALSLRIILSLDGWFTDMDILYLEMSLKSRQDGDAQSPITLCTRNFPAMALRHSHCLIIGQLLTPSSS